MSRESEALEIATSLEQEISNLKSEIESLKQINAEADRFMSEYRASAEDPKSRLAKLEALFLSQHVEVENLKQHCRSLSKQDGFVMGKVVKLEGLFQADLKSRLEARGIDVTEESAPVGYGVGVNTETGERGEDVRKAPLHVSFMDNLAEKAPDLVLQTRDGLSVFDGNSMTPGTLVPFISNETPSGGFSAEEVTQIEESQNEQTQE